MRSKTNLPPLLATLIWLATQPACHGTNGANGNDAGASSPTGLGIAECDDFLSKYARCIADKAPPERKQVLQEGLERTRSTWSSLATNPGARPGLPQACSLALETAKITMKPYACSW
jgi:hypothetical protein